MAISAPTWWCDVCGKNNPTSESCCCNICNFSACPAHCSPGQKCKPVSYCRNRHPLYNLVSSCSWTCDGCRIPYFDDGRRFRCKNCDYDKCLKCLSLECIE
ncbi:hypothetical protein C2G38_60607 [Gigaspora rosea]|uniref:Uncharacterized protein n=1 Tax=Gigaspora rosea TaxID=44941 RepID=A0A397UTC5_9GLOM|nr:hypothetical protein C2G38_60607 [Gigaspora rosea]